MNPSFFDQVVKSIALDRSRRQAIKALAALAVAGAGLARADRQTLATTETTPEPGAGDRPVFPPIFVPSNPVIDPSDSGGPEATPSFQPPEATPAAAETVCGVGDESQDVEFYNGDLGVSVEFMNAHQASVGNLRWNANLHQLYDNPGNVNGVNWCSGTLISESLFLTAGHCFEQQPTGWTVPRINGTGDPISRDEIAVNMKVAFNFQWDTNGKPRPEERFTVLRLVEDRLDGLDFAILELAESPARFFGHARIAPVDPPLQSTICIIGHPRGLPKRLEAGTASEYQGPNVYYNDIDTDGGSSGSGILSSPDGFIVGIHTNGGCRGEASGNNYGFRVSSLVTASPTLQQILAGSTAHAM